MHFGHDTTRERRRDQRVLVEGRATLRPEDGRRLEASGRIVDVAPLGVRVRVEPPRDLHLGGAVALDLEVKRSDAPPDAMPLHLRGRGIVVRRDDAAGGAGVEVAISLEAPLVVHEAFAAATV